MLYLVEPCLVCCPRRETYYAPAGFIGAPWHTCRGDVLNLLLVDDDERLTHFLSKGLTARGFAVHVEHDGLAGEEAACVGDYDALIVDLILPRLNGYELVRNLRVQSIWTPAIVLSSKDGEYDQLDAYELGVDDYLVKPISLDLLTAHVRAHVRRRQLSGDAGVLAWNDVVLDPFRGTLARGGREVEVTSREFALIHFLMRSGGRIATKSEILENVWGTDFLGGPNVVEVYVGYVRRKLDVPGRPSFVETVRGRGYRLSGYSGEPAGRSAGSPPCDADG